MRAVRFFSFLMLLNIYLLTACQNLSDERETGLISTSTTVLPTQVDQLPTPPTELIDSKQSDPTVQPTPDAMRFSLPTPGAQPVTAWRPPLYPVPWGVSPFDHFFFTRPIAVDQINWPSPDYRYGGVFFKPSSVHTGIDISAKMGTPVQASGPGVVVWAGWGLYSGIPSNKDDPYGLSVVILHDFGYLNLPLYTVYAHLEHIDVIPRQRLQTGDILGKVGQTGFTTGPHLHFEVRLGENTYFNTSNPELWLAIPQGWGVLAARITDSFDNPIPDLKVNLVSDDTELKWSMQTYPPIGVLTDQYYQENLVMSDLPAGDYTISFRYPYTIQERKIHIFPGQITYFTFKGLLGFGSTPPPTEKSYFFFTPTP